MAYKFNIFTGTFDIVSVTAGVGVSNLLLEIGDQILLENGDAIQLEA